MEDAALSQQQLLQDSETASQHSSRSSGSSPGPGSGTGVFIPACILDGSAMTNPAIAAKFPRRQRRGSAGPGQHSSGAAADAAAKQPPGDGSPGSRAEANASASQERGHNTRNARHQQGGSSHSTSAKNPFAATPKNIRQQQLLCNLVAAADSFSDPSGGPPPAGASRAASLDYGSMPPPLPNGSSSRPSTDRPSMDMPPPMSRATSRTSLESWGYMRGRHSCEVNNGAGNNRASMESYTATSMRSSMDRASCWSGRPSVDSTFSAYGPVPPSPQLLAHQQAQQQQQQVAATAAAAAAAAVAARASFEAALPPAPAGSSINRMGLWQPGRASCDLGALHPMAGPQSAFMRYSLDSAADAQVQAAAAAAAASALQLEQQRSLNGLLRYDSTAMSSSGSMDSATTPCPPSPAPTPAELAAAAAAINARRSQVAQLQQLQEIIDSMSAQNGSGGISAETAAALATLTAQGVSPDTAALLLMQAQQSAATAAAAAAGSSNGTGGLAPEAVLFQQQLQQIMQANQMAAAAASTAAQAAAASKLYAATAARSQASQQRQQDGQRWQRLGYDAAEAELYPEQAGAAALASAFDAGTLQQQLELLQRMQL